MEAVILCGIQASGKSTLYRARWFDTHVRINGDMLRTAHRERVLTQACLTCGQPYVLDKMNLTAADRARARERAAAHGFRTVCCFIEVDRRTAIGRNHRRAEAARVPVKAILGSAARLEVPTVDEGFDELLRAVPGPHGTYVLESLRGGAAGDERGSGVTGA